MVAEASRFDQWVESVYHRNRSHYHWLLIGTTVLVLHLVLAPAFVGLLGPLWSQQVADWPGILLIIEFGILCGSPSLIWVVRVHHGALIRYVRDEPDADPVEVWVTSVAELPQGVLRSVVGYLLPLLVANTYIGVQRDFSPTAHVATGLAVAISVAGSGAFMYLFWEIALRPVVREIAPRLPDDLVLGEKGLSLASKLLFLLVTLSLFNGVAVGAVAFNQLDHDTRLIVTVGTAILLSATLAGALVWMIEHSFVSRIDELGRALRSLSGGGGLDLRLPPLAGDDLDEAGNAFNELVRRLKRHDTDMQESRARIVNVAIDERRRMERDLHDGAQQHLALLNLQLSVLERSAREYPELTPKVTEMRSCLVDALAEMRDLAHGIYPAALENDGLAAALAEAGSRATLPTRLEADGIGRASRDIEAAVYFCCLEAIQNASKHAGEGATATITLAQTNGTLDFSVADDGVGFDPATDGHGFDNMRDRIGALGGQVTIDSAPGQGVAVSGSVPLRPAGVAID